MKQLVRNLLLVIVFAMVCLTGVCVLCMLVATALAALLMGAVLCGLYELADWCGEGIRW